MVTVSEKLDLASYSKTLGYLFCNGHLKKVLFLQDVVFLDEMAHFDRERIPERVVHAKGAGAFGYFEVTHDITDLCKVS